jgi:ketosteroid isomerase-like protein
MNRTALRVGLTLALALLVGAPLASAQSWSAEQQEVWNFELSQWKRAAAKDSTWVEELVHPAALVWGNANPGPQGKASIARWERYNSGNATTLEQELYPLGIVVHGNMAVVHYRYTTANEDLKKERKTVSGRYMDVLVKENGRWQFIGWAGGDDPEKD